MNKTYSQKPAEVTRKWVVVDASEDNLGRVATTVAKYLIGKYKPSYTAHIDGGDFVVVVNAAKVKVSGTKMDDKMYYRHSGFPGGIKERTLKEQLEINPAKVIELAVTGMLPKNKLVDGRLKRLKIFAGADHNHAAQSPVKVEVER
ncbi:MAG TPA: 50S ribosomal protein L13 [Candidatus Saccharimonadales bacterium]|nr:50S ribosomal protein L13 [Candidatus Saccharimonadales bacterium]